MNDSAVGNIGVRLVAGREGRQAARGVLASLVPIPRRDPSRDVGDLSGSEPAEVARLRDIAAEAEHFTGELDNLHARFAALTGEQARPVATILEQAAAAAHDLAVTANHAAAAISHPPEDHTA